MNEKMKKGWQWNELDPLTRSIVAAFSWRIGDETQGDISGDDFADAMAEIFDDVSSEDVTKIAAWSGPVGMHSMVVNRLSEFQQDHVTHMTQQLGRLAGGSEAVMMLAAQAGTQLVDGSRYEAIPALRVLSELAVERR